MAEQHPPLHVLSPLTVLLSMALAILLTAGVFWKANACLQARIDEHLAYGVVPPWEDPAVSDMAKREWTEDDWRYQRLRWLDPGIYDSAERSKNDQAQAYWLRRLVERSYPEGENAQQPLGRLDRAFLERFVDLLRDSAKRQGGAWPRDRRPSEDKDGGRPYLRSLLLGNDWREDLDRRLRGTVDPDEWPKQGGALAHLRSLAQLRDPVPPRPLEGHFWLIDRTAVSFSQDEPELEALEVFVDGMILRLRRAAGTPYRLSIALNGPIQWLTVLVAVWCSLLLLLRAWWVGRWSRSAERLSRLADDPDRLVDRVASAAGNPGDSLEDWLISIVPMIGFIGTIVGMMLAMGNAGDVVTAVGNAELQRAVDRLSGYLGTAFDTTLIALLVAIPLEGARRMVGRSQARMIDRLDASLVPSSVPAAAVAAPPAGAADEPADHPAHHAAGDKGAP